MSEKEGGNSRPIQFMQNLRDCLDDCGMHEIMFVGDEFTWSRGEIKERLDRAVCNDNWATLCPYAAVLHEHHTHSDHRPILVDTNYYKSAMNQQQTREQRFE